MWQQGVELFWIVFKIILILLPIFGCVALMTTLERKVIGFMQCRLGPNRHGIAGLLQPVMDTVKLLTKELITPSASNRYLFRVAPILSLVAALMSWSVIPFANGWVLANINAGSLFLLSASSLGIYGILLGGWSSNSKYAFLGTLRAAAQVISYEIPMGFAWVGVLMAANSLNLTDIVHRQAGGILHWYIWRLFPLFMIYWIAAVAETNRAPFDVAEGESEIVAGFHVEYSGMGFALFFLAEYANMLLVSAIASVMFLGGWASPFAGIPVLDAVLQWVPGVFWFGLKIGLLIFVYFWMRATFPRYRYDQIMRLSWCVLIPVSLLCLVVVAILVECHVF